VPRYGHAVLGGTFDHFHLGHMALLESAFRAGRLVSVGVTTDQFVGASLKPHAERIQPYRRRRRVVLGWARRHYPGQRVRVVPLENRFGRSIEEGVDVLVVSAETLSGGKAVNVARRRLGRRPLPIVVVPVVLADDLRPVSSRRIRSGEIDALGRRLAPMRVGIVLSHAEDRTPVRRAVRRAFPTSTLRVSAGWRIPRRAAAAALARRWAKKAAEGQELGLAVVRAPRGGWRAVERAPAISIGPVRIRRGDSAALQREVTSLLRPRLGRKAFGPSRT
jgi:pantetheine-phosphate adenylyltransferase